MLLLKFPQQAEYQPEEQKARHNPLPSERQMEVTKMEVTVNDKTSQFSHKLLTNSITTLTRVSWHLS